jgi:hypothetical protein
MPGMSDFADLTLRMNAAYERLVDIGKQIMGETDPRGTRSELMVEFTDADDAYRNLNAQWHRAFHDPHDHVATRRDYSASRQAGMTSTTMSAAGEVCP